MLIAVLGQNIPSGIDMHILRYKGKTQEMVGLIA